MSVSDRMARLRALSLEPGNEASVVLEGRTAEFYQEVLRDMFEEIDRVGSAPVPMLLWCPMCNSRHYDVGEFATKSHHTHACQTCGHVWRPAIIPTLGVQFLPGFKNEDPKS